MVAWRIWRRGLRRVGLATTALVLGAVGAVAVTVERPWETSRSLFASPLATLPVPVEGVAARDLRDCWGARRSGGRLHRGIDIFAACGTHVRAAASGTVLRVGTDRLGGNVAWVLGPGAVAHYYAHLREPAGVALGSWVEAGDVIGLVGNTGNARTTPCHLHYGVYGLPAGATNPYPLLTGRP
jgi:murein DD-endopeptidase MepM/ murein hydrolase activator NlpD